MRTMSTPKILATEGAPKAIGPYSQGLVSDGFLFASGQIPLDPATGVLVTGGIEQAVERVFDNIEAILAAGGARLDDVVKTTVLPAADVGLRGDERRLRAPVRRAPARALDGRGGPAAEGRRGGDRGDRETAALTGRRHISDR
jgi:2-iminobutanoate/2-iminopropanoate deaminase